MNFAFIGASAAAPNFGAQLICRYLAGLGASTILAIHGASIADIFGPKGRSWVWPFVASASFYGKCFTLATLLTQVGTALAPVVGGWFANDESLNWRWTDWIAFILSGAALLITILLLPETFAPILLRWKAAGIRAATGDSRYISHNEMQPSLVKRLLVAFQRASIMTTQEYIVIILGLWLVIVYVVVFGFLQGFRYLFKETFGFSHGQEGSSAIFVDCCWK